MICFQRVCEESWRHGAHHPHLDTDIAIDTGPTCIYHSFHALKLVRVCVRVRAYQK